MPHTSSHHAGRKPEPVAIAGGATVLVTLATLVGFDLDPGVAGAIITGVALIGGAWARSRVTPEPKRKCR